MPRRSAELMHIHKKSRAWAKNDTHAEKLIQKATKEITKGKTSLIIAHRLATIKRANSIIVLDKGRIVETGTHSELLKIPGGIYKNLYEVQFVNAESVI